MDIPALLAAIDNGTAVWHTAPPPTGLDATLALHWANFQLWHLEDDARDRLATPDTIARTKRAIDTTNQRRNDLVEVIDTALLQRLTPVGLPAPAAPLHSETPGQILDRLSILSLKRFHTAQEATRPTADPDHRARNGARLLILNEQSKDLALCLAELWEQILAGTRRFKLYRQMKMYNDPTLNPVLYRNSSVDSDE